MKLKKLFLLSIFILSALRIYADIYEGSCGENVNYTLDTSTGVLKITGTGAMDDYGAISTGLWSTAPWYSKNVETVEISEGVTTIGSKSFDCCSYLVNVSIPSSITSIGNSAFNNCSGLSSVTIPNSVTSIGSGAFYNCSGLTSVTIPNSVTSIESNTFYGCSGLTSVTMPNSVSQIGSNAFDRCSGLTSVTIPNSVTSIGEYNQEIKGETNVEIIPVIA